MEELIPNITILSVGVEEYDSDGFHNLFGAHSDLDKIKETLVNDEETSIFRESQYHEFRDPSLSEVYDWINSYIEERSAVGEILIFYFSGHGVPLGLGDFGFALTETKAYTNNMVLPLTVLRFSDILKSLRIAHVTPIFIIDTCYSGSIGTGELQVPQNQTIGMMQTYVNNSTSHKFLFLCSCTEDQTSVGTRDGGVFTNYLLDAVRNGNSNKKKARLLTLEDLFPHIEEKLTSYTSSESVPCLFKGMTCPEIPFVKNTKFKLQTYNFASYYMDVLNLLWSDGEPIESAIKKDSVANSSAYGNHSKLSYPGWLLVEDVPGSSPRKRRLTERGKQFMIGELQVHKVVREDPQTGEFHADENSPLVGIGNFL